MRLVPRVLLILSSLWVPASASAQQPPPRDPQAIAVLQQSLAAMGGTRFLTIQDSQATGTVKIYSSNGPVSLAVVIKSKGTKQVRHEVQTQSGTHIRILNQGRAAMQNPDGHVRTLVGNNTMAERVNHIPGLSLLAEWADPSLEIQYVGTGNVNGRPADVVALAYISSADPVQAKLFRKFTRTLFYIDQGTKAVLKMEFKNFAENDTNSEQKAEIFFSDYRLVSGVFVPFHQATYADGNLISELSLSSVAFNVGVFDSQFSIPSRR